MSRVKRAFSYVRFSDPSQAKGDSLRRQGEWATDLCQAQGWNLDAELQLHDKGISAFHGKNAATGRLAAFRDEIGKGNVKPGDVLIVESLDRLTREAIQEALELFLSILRTGVEIHTREPNRHYTKTSNAFELMEAIIYMERANNESATKSMRGKEHWKNQRAKLAKGNPPIHNTPPAWLRLSKDRQRFETDEEAVKAVKLIYQLAGQGLGTDPIVAHLNQNAVKVIGNNVRRKVVKGHWARSYVSKILADKAAMGEYQPHIIRDGKRVPHGEPIKGYFPAIISETEWYAVRHAVSQRGVTRGRNGEGIANIFTGLIRDARDGQTMQLQYAGSSRKANCRMLESYGARNGEPKSKDCLSFPYDPIEKLFLATAAELKASDILGTGAVNNRETEIAALKEKSEELGRKIAAVQKRIGEQPDIDALLDTLTRLETDQKAVNAQLENLKAESAHKQPNALAEVQSVAKLLRETTDGDKAKQLRLKIRAQIRQLVSEIWMIVWDVAPRIRAAELQITFASGKVRGLLLGWLRRGHCRGLTTGFGKVIVQEGEEDRIYHLKDYAKDKPTRDFFNLHQELLAPVIQELIEAEVKVRDSEEAIKKAEREPTPAEAKAKELREQGKTLMAIAIELNNLELFTITGKTWKQARQITDLLRSHPA